MRLNYTGYYQSPIGRIIMQAEDDRLFGLYFDRQNDAAETANVPVFEETTRWLDCYFDGKAPDFTPPLLLCGTPFQTAVWNILLKIPYGEAVTYGAIAKEIAAQRGIKRMSAQAVGGAVGSNPIAVIVPCHRVLGSGGQITGYAGGLDKKRHLLTIEGISWRENK